MTETAALLAALSSRDVHLSIEGGRLKCSAPPGALDADTRALLASRRDEVLAFLQRAQSLESAPANIVPIKPDGHRTPLFVLSGHGGDVYYLLSLVRHLDADRPVLSVQPPGLDGGEPLTTVEDLARYEIAQIRLRQPKGPYLIAGHCAGGTIAFEAARQLVAAGEEVAMLVLIGSPYPTAFSTLWQRTRRLREHWEALRGRKLADQGRYLAGKLQNKMQPKEIRDAALPAIPQSRQRVEAATMAAVRAYRPKTYTGVIDLIVTSDHWHQTGRWAKCAGSVREHRIEQYEINQLLLGPEVTLLAEALRRPLSALAV